MNVRRWVLLSLLFAVPVAHGGIVDNAQRNAAATAHSWSVAGGDVGVRWNTDILGNLGIAVEAAPAGLQPRHDIGNHQWFALGNQALEFGVVNNTVEVFTGGELQMRGGYVLELNDGNRIDLRDARLRPRRDAPKVFDLVGADGQVWFRINHLMYDLNNDNRTFTMHAADVRVSGALAARLHSPALAGQFVGGISWNTSVVRTGSNALPDTVCNPFPWPGVAVPGVPGATYEQDLFMKTFPTIDVVGCAMSNLTGHCDGPGGDDGVVAYSLATLLKDNVNSGSIEPTIPGDPLGTSTALYSATIAWYMMFNPDQDPPNSQQPPYDNDQQAYILWNLYRFNADGSLEQVGRSGLKHAYHANTGGACLDNCNSSHALGRGCEDEYSTGDNDNPANMGPRSEVVPATGIWGRCGSIWDTQCTGNRQPPNPPGDPYGNGNDGWTQVMKTRETQLDPAVNPGATYLLEAWYVARDDINIYNSMATEQITPTWVEGSPGVWLPANPTGYRLGPAIDRWVDPTNPPANSENTELAPAEGGHVKVAVKATDLGGGNWRYDYAVVNLDFSRAVVVPPDNGYDPRVVSNQGFDSFSIPLTAGSSVIATSFRDNANTGDQPWTVTVGSDNVTWNSAGTTLDWGSMYAFSVTTNVAPGSGSASLHVALAGSPAAYDVASLVPARAPVDMIFENGFDN